MCHYTRQLPGRLALCALLASCSVDSNAVEITADRVVMDQASSLFVYSGNVALEDASYSLTADELEMHTLKDRLQKLLALGKPARFKQQSAHHGEVTAQANSITYLPGDRQIYLKGKAIIFRSGSEIRGEALRYDLRAGQMQNEGSERVQITIPVTPDP